MQRDKNSNTTLTNTIRTEIYQMDTTQKHKIGLSRNHDLS